MLNCLLLNLPSLGSALHCVCLTLASLVVTLCQFLCHTVFPSELMCGLHFLDRFRPSLHSYFNPIMVTLNIESVIICAALCYVTHSAKRVNSFGGLY